jgi:hypothetical protein
MPVLVIQLFDAPALATLKNGSPALYHVAFNSVFAAKVLDPCCYCLHSGSLSFDNFIGFPNETPVRGRPITVQSFLECRS